MEKPLPKAWEESYLIGHQAQQDYFLKALTSGELHHAFLFEGPKGVGKKRLSFNIARFLIRHGNAFQKKSEEALEPSLFGEEVLPKTLPTKLDVKLSDLEEAQIRNLSYPDLLYIGRDHPEYEGEEKTSISVDAVRRLHHFLSLTASHAAWRIIIIDEVDTLTINAQNALLKMLEEPPKETLFLLITHRAALLLPTIKSRCQKIKFSPLQKEEIESCFTHYYPNKTIYPIGEEEAGSFGQIAEKIEKNLLEPIAEFDTLLKTYPNFNYAEFSSFFEKYKRLKENALFKAILEKIESWIHTQLLERKNEYEKWLTLWEDFKKMANETEKAHLDRAYMLLNFLITA